jgi:hypothetical protein
MHELSEPTKRVIDIAGAIITALAGAVSAITLADVALLVTIAVGLLQGFWIAMRIRNGLKNGLSGATPD